MSNEIVKAPQVLDGEILTGPEHDPMEILGSMGLLGLSGLSIMPDFIIEGRAYDMKTIDLRLPELRDYIPAPKPWGRGPNKSKASKRAKRKIKNKAARKARHISKGK